MPRFITLATLFSVAENAILYPLEVIKTRVQVDHSTQQKHGLIWMFNFARNIVKHDGARSLYRGFGWYTFASLPSNVLYITSYNSMKQHWINKTPEDAIFMRSAVIPMVAGSVADILSIFFWNPVEIIVQRLQIEKRAARPRFFDTITHKPTSPKYAGVALIESIYHKEGWRGFYRGLGASILTSAPASALWWPAYECSKLALAPIMLSKDGSSTAPLHVLHSVAGLSAGAWTMVCTNPFDVAKTRLQTQTETYGATSALPAMARIFKHEGARGLMKGLLPRLVYSVPASGLVSFTYELVLSLSRVDK